MRKISILLISFFLFMHICSAVCLSGVIDCCVKKELSPKSCCEKKNNHDEENNGCDKLHLKYFSSIGQYSEGSIQNLTPVQPTPAPVFIIDNNNFSSSHRFSQSYIFSHSPPPKSDIRIIIHSFII